MSIKEAQNQMFDAFDVGQTLNPDFKLTLVKAEINEDYKFQRKLELYVKIALDDQKVQSEIAHEMGKKPVWNQSFVMFKSEPNLLIELWQQDQGSEDAKLGSLEIDIDTHLVMGEPGEELEIKQNIKDSKGKFIGTITFIFQEILPENEKQEKQQKQSEAVKKNLEIKKTEFSKTVDPQELKQKVSEIQQRLDNIQIKIKVGSSAKYSQDQVHKVLLEGLQIIGKERPANPIRELGLFLMQYQDKN